MFNPLHSMIQTIEVWSFILLWMVYVMQDLCVQQLFFIASISFFPQMRIVLASGHFISLM